MEFLGIGIWEIILILLLALILWKPSKIVVTARTLGKLLYNLKKGTSDFTSQIVKDIEDHEKKDPPEESKRH
jgi:Sec-independent protein translocase protein TatA